MRTCVLCDNKTAPEFRLCTTCFKQYREFVNEPWFREIDKLQRKQDKIDVNEGFILLDNANVDMTGKNTPLAIKRSVGRPATPWQLVNQVLVLFDCSLESEKLGKGKRLSLRGISKKLNNRVKYLTVRRILLMYRKDDFMTYTRKHVS